MKADRNYLILCIIAFLQGFVFYGPVATVYRQSRGISIYEIFLIESVLMVLMVAFEIPWGWFADSFGYKKTLVLALFANFIARIIFYRAFSFKLFLLERILVAISVSGISGCDTALLYNSVEKEHSERAFGRYYSLSTLGFLLATTASTFIIPFSIDLTAALTIIPYGMSAAAALFLREVEKDGTEKPDISGSMKRVFRNKRLFLLVIAVALLSEVAHAVTVFLNQLQYQRSGIDVRYFGVIMAVIQLLTMLSSKSYVVTGSIGQGKTVGLMASGVCLGTLLLAFTGRPAASVLLIALVGLCNAMILPVSTDIQNKSISTADRATILSAYAMLMDVVAALTNLIIGRTANHSIELSFMICSAVSAAALLLIICFFRRSGAAGEKESTAE
ncbi:MAG TPA: MFS transporter [Clostridia bacterium]|nr:MFS transporter [Clostridia bacterium]